MIKNKKWEVRFVKLNELIPNPDNPRTITAENFGRLKKKLKGKASVVSSA